LDDRKSKREEREKAMESSSPDKEASPDQQDEFRAAIKMQYA
jgi:hypothetical protein